MSLTPLVLSDLADAIAKNSLLKAIEDVANNVNLAIAQINTNTAKFVTLDAKLAGLVDCVTITLSTFTVVGINTAIASIQTQRQTNISALKA